MCFTGLLYHMIVNDAGLCILLLFTLSSIVLNGDEGWHKSVADYSWITSLL